MDGRRQQRPNIRMNENSQTVPRSLYLDHIEVLIETNRYALYCHRSFQLHKSIDRRFLRLKESKDLRVEYIRLVDSGVIDKQEKELGDIIFRELTMEGSDVIYISKLGFPREMLSEGIDIDVPIV